MTKSDDELFNELLSIAEKQAVTTKEPKNGGGTVSSFFSAMSVVDEDYKPAISLNFKQVLSK